MTLYREAAPIPVAVALLIWTFACVAPAMLLLSGHQYGSGALAVRRIDPDPAILLAPWQSLTHGSDGRLLLSDLSFNGLAGTSHKRVSAKPWPKVLGALAVVHKTIWEVLMQRLAMFGILLAGLSPVAAIAQTPASDAKPSQIQQPPSTDPAASDMRPVAVGDHWTYLSRDNLTGDLVGEFTQTVTDVGSTDVSVSVKFLGAGLPSYTVFDRQWNVKSTSIVKFEPNDGTGVNNTMKVNDTWNAKASDIRASRTLWKRVETSKVIGQESVTTSAGTFNAIKYETVVNIHGAVDPAQKATVTTTTWWVPEINHWVKRSEKTVRDKQVKSNYTVELTDYGRS